MSNDGVHFQEMQSHLKANMIFTPSIRSTPPEFFPRTRPSVIKDSAILNEGFLNRLYESFAILEQIGKGTYGKVYKAVDLHTKDMVAMKFIKMENETEGCKSLSSSNSFASFLLKPCKCSF